MNRLLSTLALGSALALTGCEDVVDLNVPAAPPLLAVDGAVTDQPGPYEVRLTRTAPYFLNEATPPVTGARLVLSDDAGYQETLREQRPGVYVTDGRLRGQVGRRYTLAIEAEGERYRAETEIRRAQGIDSLRAEYRGKEGLSDARYSILYFGQEPAGRGDYYRFKVFCNGVLRNRPRDLYVRSDERVDGNYLYGLTLARSTDGGLKFGPGDRVRVEVSSLPPDYYFFLNELVTQITRGGLFAPPPANVRTNVFNVEAGSAKQAVGYFAGYAVRADSLVVR